jgi:hypothetical protein
MDSQVRNPEHGGRMTWALLASVCGAALLNACTTTTLLSVKFDSDTVGAPPASSQAVGTVALDNGSGSITVVGTPSPDINPTKWAQISHPTAPSPQTSMRCSMPAPAGDGSFTLTTALFIPRGGGVATIQLEPFGQPESSYFNFLHIDFLTDGTLRVNDASTFGHFPHNQVFILSVNLTVSATAANAHIAMIGADTSGTFDVAISPGLLNVARQFGAVRVWMGFQFAGQFFADDVLVLKKTS